MPTLSSPLRGQLDRTIRTARIEAEAAVAEAIVRLGLVAAAAPDHLNDADKDLRRHLRAHARRLGDTMDAAPRHLIEQAAYLRWHRLLFVRFLEARELLRHPEGDMLTIAECAELSISEGATDGWTLAARYASRLLPAVFAEDDPTLALKLAPERDAALRRLVIDLPPEVFAASDSLGWTYQYWRAAEKYAVNASGVKIGADELPAVTQLFTEPYMVRFLLDNTLGAWWAGKRFAADPALKHLPDEPALRAALALDGANWAWLRFVREDNGWRPAAGSFPGWPQGAQGLTVLDPCCGSGHFLTEALPILVAMRCAEEGLSADAAVAAVLRDNLHGLEIDGRCVQIASFAVALAAWEVGGYQPLPNPHIAWVGSPPPLPRAEFEALGNGDPELRRSLGALYDLFRQAPLLGSLIEVSGGDLVARANLDGVEAAMARLAERTAASEPERAEGAVAAGGMADAAALLVRKWVLQVTNVPFLGRTKFSSDLSTGLRENFPLSSGNMATAMIERMTKQLGANSTLAFVSPQNWYLQPTYLKFREMLWLRMSLKLSAALGPGAFEAIVGEQVVVGLTIAESAKRVENYTAITVETEADPEAKSVGIRDGKLNFVPSPTASTAFRVLFEPMSHLPRLSAYADFHKGLCLGDDDAFRLGFWELHKVSSKWYFIQTSPGTTTLFDGMNDIFLWENGRGRLINYVEERLNGSTGAWIRGLGAWGKSGITIQCMGSLPAALYGGHGFDSNVATVTFKDEQNSTAIWSYFQSEEYRVELRKINKEMKVGDASIVGVPFDLPRWTAVAAERYPNGLPEPYSDDPTQWLFHGDPMAAETGTQLHVALGRLAGYRWPAESDTEMHLSALGRAHVMRASVLPAGDADGLLPLGACSGERPLAERLRSFLAATYGSGWSADLEKQLVDQADAKLGGTRKGSQPTLEDWLATRAFAQHCKLFHDRPFLWHIWDGRADGFSAFVDYHRLDRRGLEKLTYTLINDWIARAEDPGRQEAARALQARLARIIDGESPYDIFVRWKPLARQPLGWEPDLDDGVRMNIRPFITAEVLRAPVNIHWRKDRGADVASAPWFAVHKGVRINDFHTTLAAKQAARAGK